MVSGRAAAALGFDLLLAQGRRAAVARSRAAGATQDDEYAISARAMRSVSPKRWRGGWASIRITSMPAFEDPLYYLQRERQLPMNVDPVDNQPGRSARSASACGRCSSAA